MNWYITTHLTISPSKQNEQSDTLPGSSIPWEDFPSPLSSRDVPEMGYHAAAVHFPVVPAYCAEPSENKTCVFPVSVQALMMENSPMKPYMQAWREKVL